MLERTGTSILGYSKWENFSKVIDKAKTACESSGVEVSHHFTDIRKMITLGKGAQQKIEDIFYKILKSIQSKN